MASDLFSLTEGAQADLGSHLFGQMGPSLFMGAQPAAARVQPSQMAGMPAPEQQYARYSNWRDSVNYENNLLFQGNPSSATYLLHPDAIGAASNELDARELRAEMSANQWTEDQVNSLVELARAYPGVAPGVLEGMARGGISDASPDGQYILEQAHRKTFGDDLKGMRGQQVTPEKIMSTLGPDEATQQDFWATNPIGRAVKGTVRTGLGVLEGAAQALGTGAQAAWLEAQNQGDAGERLERLGKEGGGGSLAEIIRGAVRPDEDIQLGGGWLPTQGGLVTADEQGRITDDGTGTQMSAGDAAHRRIMQFEGRWLTPGRLIPESVNATSRDWFGVNVIQPGAKAYNVTSWIADTTFQLHRANPANILADLPAASVAARRAGFAGSRTAATAQGARDVLTGRLGQINGLRRTVDSDQAIEWLNSADGGKFVEYVAGETSLTNLMKQPGIGLKEANLLRGADNARAVRDIIEPLMGRHVTTAPLVSGSLGAGAAWRGAGGRVDRMFNLSQRVNKRLLPHFGGGASSGLILNPGDLDGVYRQMQDWMGNARFTPGQREAFNRALAEVPESDPLAVERVIRNHFDPVARANLVDSGVDEKLAQKATQRFRTRADEDRMYWVDEVGNPRRVTGATQKAVINGEVVYGASPAMMAEYVSSAIPMPDPGEMRRVSAMKGIHRLVNMEGYKTADRVLTKAIGRYWKPAALLRPAYILRVAAAEQMRIAAMGMDSFFSDPASVAAYALGRKGDVTLDDGTRLLEDSKQFRAAMNRLSTDSGHGRAGWMNDGKFRAYRRADNEDAYFSGWANELQMAAEDPVVQHLLEHGRDATIDWFWEGQGRLHREAMMTNEAKHAALNRRGVDPASPDYIDSVEGYIDDLGDIVDGITGGDSELLDALRTGKARGIGIPDTHWTPKERGALRRLLAEKADNGAAPSHVRGTRDSEALLTERRGLIDRLMDGVLTHPTNKLSRAPMFKQSYWDNMLRMAPDMDAATLDRVTENAIKAKLDRDYIDQLGRIEPKSRQSDTVLDDFDAADLLAKDEAIEQTKKLLYDPTVRGNFATMTRNIFPFAEAWLEELRVWGNIAKTAPLRPGFRAAQGFDFLRESNPLDLDDPSEGPGVFYTNQEGKEVFAVPLGFMVPGAAAEATVEGLSMMNFNTFLPGLGPVAQLPAAVIINSVPDHMHTLRDTLMDVALPFGGPELAGENLPGEILGGAVPSWIRHAYAAATADADNPDRQLQFARLTSQTLQALVMSGEVAMPRDESEMEQLVRKAAHTARPLSWVEALLKGSMPSSPNVEYQFRDEDERLWTANVMSDYYWQMREQFGEQAAVTQMIQQFGAGGLNGIMIGQSETMRRAPLEQSEWNWAREHSEFYANHPAAAFHFTETKGEGGFSFDAYYEAINNGTVMKLPIWQQVNKANDRIGAIMYRRARERAEQMFGSDSTEQARLWLREQSIAIKRGLHGYGTGQGFEDMDPEAELALVGQAIPDAPDNEVTDAISDILRIHDEANLLASESGLANYYQSQEAAPIREAVLSQVDNVVATVPEVKTVADLIRGLTFNASEPETGLMAWGDSGLGATPSPMLGPMAGIAGQPSQGRSGGLFG